MQTTAAINISHQGWWWYYSIDLLHNGLLVCKSASKEKPRFMRPLSPRVQTHTSHFKEKCSETQIISKAGVRLLSLPSVEAMLLWDPHETREEKALPGRNLTLQPDDRGRRDGESPAAGVTYWFYPENLHCKMCTQVIFTTGIRPLSFLLHAKTFTSPPAILKAMFPYGNIWSKYLHCSDNTSFLPPTTKLSPF